MTGRQSCRVTGDLDDGVEDPEAENAAMSPKIECQDLLIDAEAVALPFAGARKQY